MKIPNMRDVILDGTPFVDLGGRAQSRLIDKALDRQRAELAANDPGALSRGERERLDTAEARLAEVTAQHDAVEKHRTALRVRRWQGLHETTLADGVMKRVTRSIPSEDEVNAAEQDLRVATNSLQEVLVWRNAERQKVDNARWWRRRKAEGVIK